MRFNARSLGGKLIISAALTLLLCMLLFAVTSWFFLKALYEHEANIELLHGLSLHSERALAILIGLGFFIIALGVTAFTFIARTFFIRPIRRLQAQVSSLVSSTNSELDVDATLDELSMLARSFNLLSESLTSQESESHAITSHMSDLLTLSDILISTLNLEDLLREIVTRLGTLMHLSLIHI